MLRGVENEWGDIYSMFNEVNVNYNDIVQNEQIIIEYLSKFSDSFSINVLIKKPYSQNPPIYKYCDQINPYAVKFLFERKDWPIDFLGQRKHQIMIICRCCKGIRNELLKIPNLFIASECDVPEDICFYRNNKLWFATITHEKISFMQGATEKDIGFLKEHKIRFKTQGDGSVIEN